MFRVCMKKKWQRAYDYSAGVLEPVKGSNMKSKQVTFIVDSLAFIFLAIKLV